MSFWGDGVWKGVLGASHGYYRRPGDGNLPECDVKEGKNWRSCCDQASTAG